MHTSTYRSLLLFVVFISVVTPHLTFGQTKVQVTTAGGKYQLTRDGQPYFIKGVGGDEHLEMLASLGGNSIRTWSPEKLDTLLDEAHKHGLTVCVGMWLGHEQHGFDYQNGEAVVQQLDDCLDTVRKYKDHPAVLMWGIGNEMEGPSGNNPAIYYAVNDIARRVKEIDPNHPTMTVIAELGEGGCKAQNIERFCPHIDIVGLNSYGGIGSVAQRFVDAGCTKPYVVTEFGPRGPWEVGKSEWGAPLESTSTEKARQYADGYRKAVTQRAGLCLGSYAFLWGDKQETTATWFGMLLPDGTRLGTVDAISEAWTSQPPANRCPEILSIEVSKAHHLQQGETITASIKVNDLEKDKLTSKWVLMQDSGTVGYGGDAQAAERMFASAVKGSGPKAIVTIPEGGGKYRLFAYVTDSQGGAATANVPLFVDGPPMKIKLAKAKLPFVLYADDSSQSVYTPSGYMGNAAAVKVDPKSKENPHSGETCMQLQYKAGGDWGGVLWQSPANDWGELPGGMDLTGASALEFWVRGAAGGERVSFLVGAIGADAKYPDSSKSELKDLELTKEWQKMRIPLEGRDLSSIKTGFGFSLAGQGNPLTFYVDDVTYVK